SPNYHHPSTQATGTTRLSSGPSSDRSQSASFSPPNAMRLFTSGCDGRHSLNRQRFGDSSPTTNMIIKTSDGGRSASGIDERLDCSVRATAIALGLSYAEAHGKLKALGRRTGCRLYKSPKVFTQHLG